MPTQCGPLSRAKAIRLTRLDECGVPVDGLVSVVSSTSFVSITTTPVYTDQEDIQITNANGDLCIDDQSDVALRWLELNILLCNIDPDAVNIITGAPLVVDDTPVTPNTVGFNWDSATDGSANSRFEPWPRARPTRSGSTRTRRRRPRFRSPGCSRRGRAGSTCAWTGSPSEHPLEPLPPKLGVPD